jgi:hypothetical protein
VWHRHTAYVLAAFFDSAKYRKPKYSEHFTPYPYPYTQSFVFLFFLFLRKSKNNPTPSRMSSVCAVTLSAVSSPNRSCLLRSEKRRVVARKSGRRNIERIAQADVPIPKDYLYIYN